MNGSKPINIHNAKSYESKDFDNLNCRGYQCSFKPSCFKYEQKKTAQNVPTELVSKKPILLEHPSQLSNFITQAKSHPPIQSVFTKQEIIPPHSLDVHEDELLEEMRKMIENHKLAKQTQKENSLRKTSLNCQEEETRRLFVSNALTRKFLEKQDIVLIVVCEELLISQIVEASLHLRVGKIVEKLDFDECLVELFSQNGNQNEVVTIPSFCMCLEDRVLFKRMQSKRKKILQRKCKSIEMLSFQKSGMISFDGLSKEKQERKFKSC